MCGYVFTTERYEERYVKGELIGNGGYGSVYAGFRKSDNQPVCTDQHYDSIELSSFLVFKVYSASWCV